MSTCLRPQHYFAHWLEASHGCRRRLRLCRQYWSKQETAGGWGASSSDLKLRTLSLKTPLYGDETQTLSNEFQKLQLCDMHTTRKNPGIARPKMTLVSLSLFPRQSSLSVALLTMLTLLTLPTLLREGSKKIVSFDWQVSLMGEGGGSKLHKAF